MEGLRFDGRVAIVTGAGGNPGLGRCYALLLASRGAKVLVNDNGAGPDGRGAIKGGGGPDDVVREITEAGGVALANHESVATRQGAENIVRAATDAWGKVDIVINNAGIAPFALFDEISDNDIERVMGVHMMGQLWMCRAVWKGMRERGYGRIVNVSSGVPLSGVPYQAVYSGAKMGAMGLARALAVEGIPHGIKVNSLMPSANTLAWETMLEPEFGERAKQQGQIPEVVAPVAVWLAHERCTLSGVSLSAASGAVHEIFISRTAGTPPNPHLSLDAMEGLMAAVRDRTDTSEMTLPDTVPGYLNPKPYDPNPRP